MAHCHTVMPPRVGAVRRIAFCWTGDLPSCPLMSPPVPILGLICSKKDGSRRESLYPSPAFPKGGRVVTASFLTCRYLTLPLFLSYKLYPLPVMNLLLSFRDPSTLVSLFLSCCHQECLEYSPLRHCIVASSLGLACSDISTSLVIILILLLFHRTCQLHRQHLSSHTIATHIFDTSPSDTHTFKSVSFKLLRH